jgi:diguanylate cyclase (GGDEF)-like protein
MKKISPLHKLFSFNRERPILLNALLKPKEIEQACLNIVKKLQTTLILEKLLILFNDELSHYIPVNKVMFFHHKKFIDSDNNVSDNYFMSQNIFQDGVFLGQLYYQFPQRLSFPQKLSLKYFSDLISAPLANCLQYQEIQKLAFQDGLTELANRNQFDIAIANAISSSKNKATSFYLLILDLNNFKKINDQQGHQTGDSVLTSFAKVLTNCCGIQADAFRFGGDEFTMIFHDNKDASVPHLVNCIRNSIVKNTFLMSFQLSCSIGSSKFREDDTLASLFERADKALYKAKNKEGLDLSPCITLNRDNYTDH